MQLLPCPKNGDERLPEIVTVPWAMASRFRFTQGPLLMRRKRGRAFVSERDVFMLLF